MFLCLFVAPLGIEPRSWVPETHILSIVLRSRWECKDKTFSLFSNKKCRTDPARRSLRCATQFLAAPFRGPAGDNSALAPRRSLERFVVTLGILPEPNPGIASPPLTKVRYSYAVPGGSILKPAGDRFAALRSSWRLHSEAPQEITSLRSLFLWGSILRPHRR